MQKTEYKGQKSKCEVQIAKGKVRIAEGGQREADWNRQVRQVKKKSYPHPNLLPSRERERKGTTKFALSPSTSLRTGSVEESPGRLLHSDAWGVCGWNDKRGTEIRFTNPCRNVSIRGCAGRRVPAGQVKSGSANVNVGQFPDIVNFGFGQLPLDSGRNPGDQGPDRNLKALPDNRA